jgi:hypothetical protein
MFSFLSIVVEGETMDLDEILKDDPLFAPDKRPLRIVDFLVIRREEQDAINYLIVQYDPASEDALRVLSLLSKETNHLDDRSPIERLGFCKMQRSLIKVYLKMKATNESKSPL